MPYTLNPATDLMQIAERQYGTGSIIQFTTFTSCIGVLAKVTGKTSIIGIHLALFDAETRFSANNVNQIIQVLTNANYDPTTVHIIGQIAFWENPENTDGYTPLLNAFPTPPTVYQFGDGTYGATIAQNQSIEITY